ncbi:hypothetical protein NDU88_004625 [Pleurodeles waltl]|uniref:Uncharacterized protein n=1 Tax=Pleurodeles waltl TaxID=8319 RepID=A0AAV7M8W2_PLEWA|nr:hypothetical protein NDU88_004625 [Pleurodeles waltl]
MGPQELHPPLSLKRVLSISLTGTTARVGDSPCDAWVALEAVKERRPTVLVLAAAAGESSYRGHGPASPLGIGDSGLCRGGPAGRWGAREAVRSGAPAPLRRDRACTPPALELPLRHWTPSGRPARRSAAAPGLLVTRCALPDQLTGWAPPSEGSRGKHHGPPWRWNTTLAWRRPDRDEATAL